MSRWPDRWIVVENWERFQPRRQRPRAPWIRLYLDLLHKSEWLDLSLEDRGLLTTIWLLYHDADGRLRTADVIRETFVTNEGRTRDAHRMFVTRSLARLNHAGFIRFSVDKPLPLTLKVFNPLDARADEPATNGRVPPCPLCEVGGGRHTADCPTLQLGVERS